MRQLIFILANVLMMNLFALPTYSQITLQDQNTLGGTGSDVPSDLVKTADGGFLLVGSSGSPVSGDKTQPSFGYTDYWVIRVDSAGNKIWDKTFGGTNDDYGVAGIELPDHSFVIGGYSYSAANGNKTSMNYGITDYWLVKIDSSGNKIWDLSLGADYFDLLTDLTLTADNNILVTGYSNSDNTGIKSENSLGSFDYWILKLDTSGSILWQNTIGGNKLEKTTKTQQLIDGSFLILGGSSSSTSGDKTSQSFGGMDYWPIRLNNTGNLIWQGTYGGDSTDIANAAFMTADGGFVIAGESLSGISGQKTLPLFGNTDLWIIRSNSLGGLLFQNAAGNNYEDRVIDITADDSTICVMLNSNSHISGNKAVYPRGGIDPWFINYDYFLQEGKQYTFGGYQNDQLVSFVPAYPGFILLMNSSSGIEAEKTDPLIGVTDFWLAQLTFLTNFNEIKGSITIDLDSNNILSSGDYRIPYHRINLFNNQAFSFTDNNGNYTIYTGDTGMYYINPLPYLNGVYLPDPAIDSAYFATVGIIDSSNNFIYAPTFAYDDLKIELIPTGPFRAGNTYKYKINYSNKGTTTLSPEIHLITNSSSNYISSTLIPTIVSGDTVIWNPGTIPPFSSGTFDVSYYIPTSTPNSSLLYNRAIIFPVITDFFPFDNEETWEIFTTGSYDPNDITVNIDSIPDSMIFNPPYLNYLIRFQNTGNDTAFYVNVVDRLPESLIDSTLDIISSSHNMEVHYNPFNRLLEFTFEDIELPDSVHSEPESHGYIHFRIKPSANLNLSDTIKNSAGIYFDYNPVVLTNIAQTVFYHPVSGVGLSENLLYPEIIYPNPANELLFVKFDIRNPAPIDCRITDLFGRTVMLPIPQMEYDLRMSIGELLDGVYFLETNYTGGMRSTQRFIVSRD